VLGGSGLGSSSGSVAWAGSGPWLATGFLKAIADGSRSGAEVIPAADGLGAAVAVARLGAGGCGEISTLGVFNEVLMLILPACWGETQVLDGERLSGANECQDGGPVSGLEAAPLGRAQAFLGELKIAQGLQARASPVEAGLQTRPKRTERRSAAARGTHDAEGRGEELPALGRALGQAIGAEQRLSLLALELVVLYRLDHGLLVLGAEHAQRVRQRRAERPRVNLALQRLTELLGQGEPLVDPAHRAATGLGDGLRPQLLLVPQGMDHAGFVQR
jgi:hypothetical protein